MKYLHNFHLINSASSLLLRLVVLRIFSLKVFQAMDFRYYSAQRECVEITFHQNKILMF